MSRTVLIIYKDVLVIADLWYGHDTGRHISSFVLINNWNLQSWEKQREDEERAFVLGFLTVIKLGQPTKECILVGWFWFPRKFLLYEQHQMSDTVDISPSPGSKSTIWAP